jgi:hypothetical protein
MVLLALGLPLVTQSLASLTLNTPRWSDGLWENSWYDWNIPAEIRQEPAYYLSLQIQTYSVLAAFLPPESRFTNLLGQNPLDSQGLVWQEVRKLQQRRHLPWRSLYAVPSLIVPDGVPTSALEAQDAILSDYGLKADRNDCRLLVIDGSRHAPVHWQVAEPTDQMIGEIRRTVVISCRLIESVTLNDVEKGRRAAIDAHFARWEVRCPAIFAPSPSVSMQKNAQQRYRAYANTDAKIFSVAGRIYSDGSSKPNELIEDENGQAQIQGCPSLLPRSEQ